MLPHAGNKLNPDPPPPLRRAEVLTPTGDTPDPKRKPPSRKTGRRPPARAHTRSPREKGRRSRPAHGLPHPPGSTLPPGKVHQSRGPLRLPRAPGNPPPTPPQGRPTDHTHHARPPLGPGPRAPTPTSTGPRAPTVKPRPLCFAAEPPNGEVGKADPWWSNLFFRRRFFQRFPPAPRVLPGVLGPACYLRRAFPAVGGIFQSVSRRPQDRRPRAHGLPGEGDAEAGRHTDSRTLRGARSPRERCTEAGQPPLSPGRGTSPTSTRTRAPTQP